MIHGNTKMDGGCDCDKCDSIPPVEETEFTLTDCDSGIEKIIYCANIKDAKSEAEDWARDGSYGEIESTIWIDVDLTADDGTDERITVAIDPDEPECDHDLPEATPGKHCWRSPYELVGGIEENPGVWGHAGGVIITEACVRCGCQKTTDTWAQRPDTGEQGLQSIQYKMGVYDIEKYDRERA